MQGWGVGADVRILCLSFSLHRASPHSHSLRHKASEKLAALKYVLVDEMAARQAFGRFDTNGDGKVRASKTWEFSPGWGLGSGVMRAQAPRLFLLGVFSLHGPATLTHPHSPSPFVSSLVHR